MKYFKNRSTLYVGSRYGVWCSIALSPGARWETAVLNERHDSVLPKDALEITREEAEAMAELAGPEGEKMKIRICPEEAVYFSHQGPWPGREYTYFLYPHSHGDVEELLYGSSPNEYRRGRFVDYGISFSAHPTVEYIPTTWAGVFFLLPHLVEKIVFQEQEELVVDNVFPYHSGPYGKTGVQKGESGFGYLLLPGGRVEKVSRIPEGYRKEREIELTGVGDSSACMAESRRYNAIKCTVYG